jgi:hypothetical protein
MREQQPISNSSSAGGASGVVPESASDTDPLAAFRPSSESDLTEMALAHKAAQLAPAFCGRIPTAVELTNITEELGVEIASALYLRTLQDSLVHGPFWRHVRTFDFRQWNKTQARESKIEVVIVASNLFQSGRAWGDHVEEWRSWARDLGFTTDVIETDPRRSVASNARVIFEYLARSPNRRRIIVTYGQGSAEFRYLLHRRVNRDEHDPLPEEVAQICGWINVCGAFAGASSSRYFQESRVRRLLSRLRMKVAGRNPITLAETTSVFPLWRKPLPVIPGIQVVSILGLPQRSQIPVSLLPTFNELAGKCPNDGAVTVCEAAAHLGQVVAIPGMSHRADSFYLEPIFRRTLAVVGETLFAPSENKSATLG